MPQKRHTVDQIVAKLRKADVELGKGKKVPEICKLLAVTDQTYYRWRQKCGGKKPVMVKQLKALKKENERLKDAAADGSKAEQPAEVAPKSAASEKRRQQQLRERIEQNARLTEENSRLTLSLETANQRDSNERIQEMQRALVRA